jgi:hypothetical protein
LGPIQPWDVKDFLRPDRGRAPAGSGRRPRHHIVELERGDPLLVYQRPGPDLGRANQTNQDRHGAVPAGMLDYRASSPSRRISAHGARAVRAYRHDADQRQLVCSPAAPLGRPRGADARAPAYRLGRRVCRPCDRGGAIAGDGRHGRLSEPPDQQPSGARPQSAEDNRRILSSGSVSAAWSRARRVVPQSIVIFLSPTVFISNLTGDDGSLEQPAPSPLQVAMSFNRILERAGHA